MIKQPQYTAAATGLSRSEWIRLMQRPKCHAYDGHPCVDARGAVRTANHIERVRAADNNIFDTPEVTGDDSDLALAFTDGYLLSLRDGSCGTRLTPQEQEVGARALRSLVSGRSLLEACHKDGVSLEEMAARWNRPLRVIAGSYTEAVWQLSAHAAPLLGTCCTSCLGQMPDAIFDSTLRCPGCLASLPRSDKPVPNALDVEEFKAACAALEARWTAPTFEIEAAYQKRIKLWNHLIKTAVQPGKRHPHAEDARAKDNGAWEFIKSYRAKYGN